MNISLKKVYLKLWSTHVSVFLDQTELQFKKKKLDAFSKRSSKYPWKEKEITFKRNECMWFKGKKKCWMNWIYRQTFASTTASVFNFRFETFTVIDVQFLMFVSVYFNVCMFVCATHSNSDEAEKTIQCLGKKS